MRPAPILRVYDDHGRLTWRGLATDFFRVNRDGIGPEERSEIVKVLRHGQEYTGGGGAAPIFRIRRLGRGARA